MMISSFRSCGLTRAWLGAIGRGVVGVVLSLSTLPTAGQERAPSQAARNVAAPTPPGHPIQRRPESDRLTPGGGSSWWFGPTGIVLALAVLGGLSWAARRYRLLPGQTDNGLEVVARAALSPRHAVYAVRAGDRVLLVGTGPGGPPALLTEYPFPGGPAATVSPPERPAVLIPRPGGTP